MDTSQSAPIATLSALGGGMTAKNSHKKSTKRTKGKDTGHAAQSKSAVSIFLKMTLNMSWQLAIAVLLPIIIGAKLDKTYQTNFALTYVGLAVAFLGAILVMWRNMQVANQLPLPKLSEAQKRAIKKAQEEEDKKDD